MNLRLSHNTQLHKALPRTRALSPVCDFNHNRGKISTIGSPRGDSRTRAWFHRPGVGESPLREKKWAAGQTSGNARLGWKMICCN